jgi:hypothetical protein
VFSADEVVSIAGHQVLAQVNIDGLLFVRDFSPLNYRHLLKRMKLSLTTLSIMGFIESLSTTSSGVFVLK